MRAKLAILFTLILIIAVFPADAQNYGTLNSHYVFPVYQTCEDFLAKTGSACPPFDATRKVKSWLDPSPPAPDEDGNVSYRMLATAKDGTPLVQNGKPYQRTVLVPRDEAARVNIPPKDFSGRIQEIKTIGEWAVPMRALGADEEFCWGFGALPKICKVGASPPGSGSSGSVDLSAVMEAIAGLAAKLDLLLAVSGPRQ